jgi:hypothetical protein
MIKNENELNCKVVDLDEICNFDMKFGFIQLDFKKVIDFAMLHQGYQCCIVIGSGGDNSIGYHRQILLCSCSDEGSIITVYW